MSPRMILTIATTIGLIGLYAGYARLTKTWFHVQTRTRAVPAVMAAVDTTRPASNVEAAQLHLPQQPWAAAADYLLRTDQAFIYTNEWAPEEEGGSGYVRCQPFAMIWTLPDKNGEPQVVTVASESARVKFEGRLEGTNPQPGRVIAAAMQGEVQVTGPDNLLLIGRNFYYEEAALRIFSDHPVKFDIGPNHGTAGSAQLDLIAATGLPSRDLPHIYGLQTVHLTRDIRLEVELRQKDKPLPITVECAGRLDYDIATHQAVFVDDVWAWRKTGVNQSDYLRCDRLELQFAPKPVSPPRSDLILTSAREVHGDYQNIETDLVFQRLTAEGESVRLRSDGQDLTATVAKLVYDAQREGLVLQHPTSVEVFQYKSWLKSPEIFLQLGNDSVGTVTCQGPGELVNRDKETGEVLFVAEWKKQLAKSRDQATGFDQLALEGAASFRQPGRKTGLLADDIRLWITPIETNDPTSSQMLRLEGDSQQIQPKRLKAVGDVILASPQLEGVSQLLEVWFEDDASSPASRQTPGEKPAPLLLTGQEEPAGEEAEAKPPIKVTATQIRVRMRPAADQEQPQVAEVWTTGGVKVEQPQKDDLLTTIEGQSLHIQNDGENRQILHITGKPASIVDSRMTIQGHSLHLDRAQNLAWVDGVGQLAIPVSRDLEGKTLATPQELKVNWAGQMSFDGQVAEFLGNVQAEISPSRMNCQEMKVTLTKRLSFTDPEEQPGTEPELQKISCRHNVEFENYEYDEENRLSAMHRAGVHEFSVEHQSGKAVAQGPGWMRTWQRGKGQRPLLPAATGVRANRPQKVDSRQWNFSGVDFAGRMEGNVHQRISVFRDRVVIVHAPVERPGDLVKPDDLPKDGMLMRCRELQVSQSAVQLESPQIELVAQGDVVLEGHNCFGRADQVTYDQAKGQFVLRSLGNAMANIWREDTPGDTQPIVANGQEILFIPAEKRFHVSRSTGGAGN